MVFNDPTQVHLPKPESKLFRKFKYSDKAELTDQEFCQLRNYGLVKGAINGKSDWFEDLPSKGIVVISDFGKRYREFLREKSHDNIRYIITTSIAVAALIISIVSICLQYC